MTMPRTAESNMIERCRSASCRVCGASPLIPVLDLGTMPVTATFRDSASAVSPAFPLEVAFCTGCSLVQLTETVPAEVSFNAAYPYFSSFSDDLLAHSRAHVEELIRLKSLGASSFVVEVASNDGYLLRNFVEKGIPCLGIEPSDGPADAARQLGIETLGAFFGDALGSQLADEGRQADVVIANNVLAHVTDQNDFVRGIAHLLKDDGIARVEFPYVRELVNHCQFDTIYHEHLCYFSLHAAIALMRRHGLFINDVALLPIHGGSLRLTIERHEKPSAAVMQMMADEELFGITHPEYYRDFAARVRDLRTRVRELLMDLRDSGNRIAAYGAAAKGVILLNFLGLEAGLLEFVVDRNPHKQGKWLPGLDVQVLAPDVLVEQMPEYALILPWNFRREIIEQQTTYRERGGKFIVPIPDIEIV